MGDAVLAIFVQAEDALQAAYAIQKEVGVFNGKQVRNGRPSFPTRIGLATGEVLIANLNIEGVREIEIIGRCVNTAVHLQQVAPVAGITIDQLTYTQCQAFIHVSITGTWLTSQSGNEPVYILDTETMMF